MKNKWEDYFGTINSLTVFPYDKCMKSSEKYMEIYLQTSKLKAQIIKPSGKNEDTWLAKTTCTYPLLPVISDLTTVSIPKFFSI